MEQSDKEKVEPFRKSKKIQLHDWLRNIWVNSSTFYLQPYSQCCNVPSKWLTCAC